MSLDKTQEFIPVSDFTLGELERKLVNDCLETRWISSEGAFVSRFETEFSQYVGRRHGIAVCNGSVAIEVALAALGIAKGDEVIMPAFTIISCAAAIVRAGAIPVLVDSDPLTWNMDVSQLASKVTPRTKAIMVVHIYGHPVDMDAVLAVANQYGLKVIEDAAQMHGQQYKGAKCGSFGDISTFSFYPNKHITTGEGGMVLVDEEHLASRCRSLRNLCFGSGVDRFKHEELGWNFRMTNVQAALGIGQLERIDETIARKRFIGRWYTDRLKDIDVFSYPLQKTAYSDNIYWVYGLVLNERTRLNVNDLMMQLGELGIGTRPFFWPMHEQPVFRKMGYFANERFPVAERLGRRGFYIPSGVNLTTAQMERVACALEKVVV